MYVVCALSKITIGAFSREVWVFVLALWLPNLVLPAK